MCIWMSIDWHVSHLHVLKIDLRPAFHWNLKQLFIFVVAEYESDKNVRAHQFAIDPAHFDTDAALTFWTRSIPSSAAESSYYLGQDHHSFGRRAAQIDRWIREVRADRSRSRAQVPSHLLSCDCCINWYSQIVSLEVTERINCCRT